MKQPKGSSIRDRIREFRRVRAGDLQHHPRNWRIHSADQRRVFRGLLAEVGYADALLVRELADGTLQIIDGHMRADNDSQRTCSGVGPGCRRVRGRKNPAHA